MLLHMVDPLLEPAAGVAVVRLMRGTDSDSMDVPQARVAIYHARRGAAPPSAAASEVEIARREAGSLAWLQSMHTL